MTWRVLVAGAAEGPYLGLSAPVCFWGGLDPETARIADPRHPNFGASIEGRVLGIPAIVGSSSSSQLLIEVLRRDIGPAAVLLGVEDVILAGGILVAGEMGWPAPPLLVGELRGFADDRPTRISWDGSVSQRKA